MGASGSDAATAGLHTSTFEQAVGLSKLVTLDMVYQGS